MDTHFQEYTQKYEYAAKVIEAFLETESIITSETEISVWDEGSFLYNFFCFSLYDIIDPRIKTTLDGLLAREETATRPYNPPRVRLISLYSRITMALGYEFMADMTTNLIQSLMQLNGVDMSNKNEVRTTEKKIRKVFQKYPELVLVPIGFGLFTRMRLNAQRKRSLTKSISGKGR